MNYKFKYKEYSQALYEALKDDAYYATMEKSIDDKQYAKEAMLKYFDYSICESEKYGEVFMPNKNKYGLSIWSKPLSDDLTKQKSKDKKEFLLNQMGENSLDTYNSIVEFMSKKADDLISEDTWYLSILGILPQFQNQGLGRNLIEPILSQTDKQGISTYLETYTQRNKTFYKRLGYEDVATFKEPITNEEYTIMRRDAK